MAKNRRIEEEGDEPEDSDTDDESGGDGEEDW